MNLISSDTIIKLLKGCNEVIFFSDILNEEIYKKLKKGFEKSNIKDIIHISSYDSGFKSSSDRTILIDQLFTAHGIKSNNRNQDIKLALEEAIMNAQKTKSDGIISSIAFENTLLVSIKDFSGTLSRNTIVDRLNNNQKSQMYPDVNGVDKGAGLGISIICLNSILSCFKIDNNVSTEVFLYFGIDLSDLKKAEISPSILIFQGGI